MIGCQFLLACKLRRRVMRIQRQNTKLARCVSKEAHFPLTIFPIFTCLSSVPSRVKPAFKHAVSKLTAVATATRAAAILRAHLARVMKPSGVTAASLFARMSKRAVSPVVAPASRAAANLELVHAEMVGGVRVRV